MAWNNTGSDIQVVLCTAPDAEAAARMGRAVVEARLAACVNIVPGLRSIYAWTGVICDDPEVLMILKTHRERVQALGERIRELHSYENPEVIAFPIDSGLEAYLAWVRDYTKPVA